MGPSEELLLNGELEVVCLIGDEMKRAEKDSSERDLIASLLVGYIYSTRARLVPRLCTAHETVYVLVYEDSHE